MAIRDRLVIYCTCAAASAWFASSFLPPVWRVNDCALRVPPTRDSDGAVADTAYDHSTISGASQQPWYRPHTALVQPTRIIRHAPGWTIFENIYMSNGTFFVVTDEPDAVPPLKYLISSNFSYENPDWSTRDPTEQDMRFISPAEAYQRWKLGVWKISGNSFIFHYPPVTMLKHYYHACAETFLGAWRFWVGSYDPAVTSTGHTTAPPIHRTIFTFNRANDWRDLPGLNAYFLFSAWPSMSIEEKEHWEDRVRMTRGGDKAWVYERVLLNDRAAASRGPVIYPKERKIAAEAYEATLETSSPAWWEPVRRSVLKFAGVEDEMLDLAFKPADHPVVTYVSRQAGRRRKLRDEDHHKLVLALEVLCGSRGWEFNHINAENIPTEEQLKLFARTTVLLGVHGNGLTHMLFMPFTSKTTVIEMFYPGGLTHDYEWPARRAFRFKHFAIWNDTWHTYPHPSHVKINFPKGVNDDGGFQGNNIPVHGETVAKIIEMRLDGQI
ncbi:hypothetical protein AURDEDRAFT_186946 [Auricularia subglabra TFB-10046 SS5]|nr:hypothetical protein AURDEDRAFT_186946 [Auricularia subglabra TFB-10046 SS5]